MHCRKDRHVAPMVQTTSLQLEMLKKIVHIRTNEQKKKSPCSLFTEPIVKVRKLSNVHQVSRNVKKSPSSYCTEPIV